MRNIHNTVKVTLLIVGLFVAGIANAAHHGEKSETSGAATHATDVKGVHQMSGTITHIDHDSGMIGLKTGAGDLTLHFPPAAIEDLNEGDNITVHLGYTE